MTVFQCCQLERGVTESSPLGRNDVYEFAPFSFFFQLTLLGLVQTLHQPEDDKIRSGETRAGLK